ncbi:hypothetical protein [Kitasatospora sp. NPDC098663]|uniref:hypothetical protein n=1 Tax=Kitasatospora sp. NPDC098663 TaxID=3364096 RepID=UPI00382788AA
MSDPIRIVPGSFGLATVNNADQAASAVLTRFGFTPPRRADKPLSLHPSGEPLADLAQVGAAARGLRRAGYEVDVAPELQLSDAGEQALEVLADLHGKLGELAGLVGRISDLHELVGVAAQMVHGAYNPADAARELFLAAARSARSADSPWREGAELTSWFEDGAEAVTSLQARAASVAYLQPSAEHAARVGAARARSAAHHTGPTSLTSSTPPSTSLGADPRRVRV